MRRLTLLLTLVTALCLPLTTVADVVVASWNIKHLGWAESGKRYDMLAQVIQGTDIVAIQEIMGEESLERLSQEVSALTGEPWKYMASHLIGRGSYREAYGFLWRDSAVEYVDGAVVFLDNRDIFSREPLSARFRSKRSGTEFALANIHVLYGDSVSDRLPEIRALADYWDWLAEVYGDTPRLLVGDFNLDFDHQGWDELRQRGVSSMVQGGATTLGTANGRYANEYDHILAIPGRLNISRRGKVEFPSILGISHTDARDSVSDHAPVWVALGNADYRLPERTRASINTRAEAANDARYDCVDLNRSDADALDRLPHIGPARAEDIIRMRPWHDVASLTKIRGIGEASLNAILHSELLCGS
ncbi:endonuclease/exonuclease/phosphatase family protein [Vreelandella rituensis]|uniref:Endonuclease n=1 Tax=Vreelandella rituensis TaxID=2282306 RepID=A0A368UA80_9GAMM|nr:endonuclease/exonuclease/phosphatase family protein [Halomonas rituensis]RCV93904.1 endonuclease [Halomonas rituensis]